MSVFLGEGGERERERENEPEGMVWPTDRVILVDMI